MTPKAIFLIRHPETDWNRQRRYQGRTRRPLTGRDETSTLAVIEWMRECGPDVVASSPTMHALALAERISLVVHSKPEPAVDDGWCEADHGAWEGLLHDEVDQRFGPDTVERFDDPHYARHGGETLAEVESRVALAWEALVARTSGAAAVVSHATPIRLVLCRCLGLPASMQWRFHVDNASVTRIDVAEDLAVIGFVNRRVQA